MKLILAGDFHIGRCSTRVDPALSPASLRSASAWHRVVDLAIREKAAVLVLSGDLVESSNRFWEAIGEIERGVKRLADAGIRTVAVAGNHDYNVLDRIAANVSSDFFTLLGAGGRWERTTIQSDGQALLHIDGWSFPRDSVNRDPVEDYNLSPDSQAPVLGLVHGDLGAAASKYAPLDLTRLRAVPVSAWLLGHIHAPRLMNDASPWILYPGSPQALDPGEPGRHGVWVTNVRNGRIETPEPLHLSSVWYDSLAIDLTSADSQGAIDTRIIRGIGDKSEAIRANASPSLECISLRITLVGETRLSDRVPETAARIETDLRAQGIYIDKVLSDTTPAINLAEHSGNNTAIGALARLLLDLDRENPTDETNDILERLRGELQQIENRPDFARLPRNETSGSDLRYCLKTQARRVLSLLAEQIS